MTICRSLPADFPHAAPSGLGRRAIVKLLLLGRPRSAPRAAVSARQQECLPRLGRLGCDSPLLFRKNRGERHYERYENSAMRHVRLSLPARSLRGRPASLRTVPDGAGYLLRKRLIWLDSRVIRPAIWGVEPIFLPALRERGQGGAAGRSRIAGARWGLIATTVISRPAAGLLS
jgi:hypothetical protein